MCCFECSTVVYVAVGTTQMLVVLDGSPFDSLLLVLVDLYTVERDYLCCCSRSNEWSNEAGEEHDD